MFDIDAITADVQMQVRSRSAGHMLDAIECITDDHVRRHVADPWAEILAGPDPVGGHGTHVAELRRRAEAAIKSLTAAIADLDWTDQLIGEQVGMAAWEWARERGLPAEVDLRWQPPKASRPGEWRWTCDLCGQPRVFVGPIHDPTGGGPSLIGLAAGHVEACAGEDEL